MKQLKSTLLLTVLLSGIGFESLAQLTYQWGGGVSGKYSHTARYMTTDASGNLYMAGRFLDSVDFDPGTGVSWQVASAGSCGYIAKYSPSGAVLWVKQIGSGWSFPEIQKIVVDGLGGIYVSGSYQNSLNFGAGSGTIGSAGGQDGFIAKFDASGLFAWAVTIGGTGTDIGTRMTLDGSGVYLTGKFEGTADFDPGSATANLTTTTGSPCAFVAKYSLSGSYLYAFKFEALSSEGVDIATDPIGNFYVTGQFSGSGDIDPGSGTVTLSSGNESIFLACFSYTGTLNWAKALTSSNTSYVFGLTTDVLSTCSLIGMYTLSMDFNPGGTPYVLNTLCSYGIYVARYDAAGNLIYANPIGETNANMGFAIATDLSGNVYATGRIYTGAVDFDPGPGTAILTSLGIANAFIAKYSPSGSYISATLLECANRTIGDAIAVDNNSNVYLAGSFEGTADLDGGVGQQLVTASKPPPFLDLFLCKYSSGPVGIEESVDSMVAVYPNPVSEKLQINLGDLFAEGNSDGTTIELTVFDVLGKQTAISRKINLVSREVIALDLNSLNDGVYFLCIEKGASRSFTRFVKAK